ncbi:hypothetical protein SAMN05443668_119126 [Cryptosporangium aurantiacum]|uniref:Uncharacterized protein n=1 Tax=Cryptosporangium aurantiacum TaxID=134849 RepID=A0A1M7RLH8_9ACTN|nr:hypothetical protein SAMN05443668_119126 [Cryptosporangium aurantiacum]
MRNARLLTAVAVSALTIGGSLALASPAQAARVVAVGSLAKSGATGYLKISQSDSSPYVLTGFVTAKDTKTDGACARGAGGLQDQPEHGRPDVAHGEVLHAEPDGPGQRADHQPRFDREGRA